MRFNGRLIRQAAARATRTKLGFASTKLGGGGSCCHVNALRQRTKDLFAHYLFGMLQLNPEDHTIRIQYLRDLKAAWADAATIVMQKTGTASQLLILPNLFVQQVKSMQRYSLVARIFSV